MTTTQFDENGTPASVTYTPTPGYRGADSFTYRVFDGQIYSSAATASLTISPASQPDSTSTASNSPVTTSVLSNDTGVDLSVSSAEATYCYDGYDAAC